MPKMICCMQQKIRKFDRNTEYERERLLFVKRMEEILLDLGAKNDPAKKRAYLEEAVDHMSWKLSYELAAREPEWTFSTSMWVNGERRAIHCQSN